MTRRKTALRLALIPALAALAACSAPERYVVPQTPVEGARVPIRYGTVAIREVSLPTYAASEEIQSRGANGAVTSSGSVLWADDPARAITQDVARYLTEITGAQVAAEPWPFFDRAQATVEIRVSDMLAEADGSFRLTGQYFVAPDAGGRGRAGGFALAAPVAPDGGPAAIAAARGETVRDLSLLIARNGLR
jgi:hypothetical protein